MTLIKTYWPHTGNRLAQAFSVYRARRAYFVEKSRKAYASLKAAWRAGVRKFGRKA
jgi:hypothetical protein